MKTTDNETRRILLNPKQALFLSRVSQQHYEAAILMGGRGGGKSHTMGHLTAMMKEELPRAKGGLGGLSVKSIKRVTLPELKKVWREEWGYREYNAKTGLGDYVMWKEPPAHFDRPYQEPEDWNNCITFVNGFCIELEGFKVTALENRGKNYDFYLIDEFAFFKEEWMKIVLPTIRANVGKFQSKLHRIFAGFTSPPTTSGGQHVWKFQDLAQAEPEKYLFVQIRTKDNQMFLPPEYIPGLKKTLSNWEFRIEVLGERGGRVENTYYSAWQEDVHVVFDEELYDPNEVMVASCDFNAHFTSATIWQKKGNRRDCVDNVFVKKAYEGFTMAESLGIAILRRFRGHKKRKLILTGDRNGKNKSAGSTKSMFGQLADILDSKTIPKISPKNPDYEEIMEAFEIRKTEGCYSIVIAPLNYNPKHRERNTQINEVLAGKKSFSVVFDGVRCKATILSIENSPMEADYSKDKSSEGRGGDQERATHLSDTVDYYLIWEMKGGGGVSGGGGGGSFSIELG